MKKGIFLLLLVSSVCVQAQSLKDALYGGKLKNGPGTVIRKGDDLTKIDTTRQVAPGETAKSETTPAALDSSVQTTAVPSDSAAIVSTTNEGGDSTVSTDTAASTEAANTPEVAAPVRNNNTIWKAYMDSVAGVLKTEALPSKKVKRGSYYVLVSYTIGTDGEVTVGDVFLSPENAYLQQQVKDRLALEAPRLDPVLNSAGKPRQVNKKANFTLVKE